MSFKHCLFMIRADLCRYFDNVRFVTFLRAYLTVPGFQFSVWMRLCHCLRDRRLLRPLYVMARLVMLHYSISYGLDIPACTEIGEGFYIGHFGGIYISPMAVIGRNCNISQGVTIGISNRGPRQGVPVIGDNVYIGPGAKIFGKITIGNCAAIGANCVVTRDVPDNGVVVGVPGHIISYEGSVGYVNNFNYPLGS